MEGNGWLYRRWISRNCAWNWKIWKRTVRGARYWSWRGVGRGGRRAERSWRWCAFGYTADMVACRTSDSACIYRVDRAKSHTSRECKAFGLFLFVSSPVIFFMTIMHLDATRHSMTLCSRCAPFLISSCLSSKLTSSPAVILASTRPWLDSRGAYFSSNTCPQSQQSGASKCGRCVMLPLAIVSPLTFTQAMQVTRTWRWVSDTKLWTNWLQSTTTKTATCTSTTSLRLSPWCNTCQRMGHTLVR